MKETDQLRNLMESFSDGDVKDDIDARRDAWQKKDADKKKAQSGRSEFSKWQDEKGVNEDNITDADYDIIVDGNTVKLTAGGHEVAVMSKQRWEAIMKHYKDPMASHNYKNHSGM